MGLQRTSHLDGGFNAWKVAGRPIVPYAKKRR
jgi:3-mercaptopyruvate sulfurtransferase SseA